MDASDLDELVSQAASTQAWEDYERLFDALRGVELYFHVTVNNEDGENGIKRSPVSTPLVSAGPGLDAVLLFTSRDNANLDKPYAGIVWERALEMLIGMPDADGLIIQSNGTGWVGLDRQGAQSLLSSG